METLVIIAFVFTLILIAIAIYLTVKLTKSEDKLNEIIDLAKSSYTLSDIENVKKMLDSEISNNKYSSFLDNHVREINKILDIKKDFLIHLYEEDTKEFLKEKGKYINSKSVKHGRN